MRGKIFLAILLATVAAPVISSGEVFFLKDGSTLQGELVRLSGDTLYVKTSFGVRIPVPKSAILRIDFAEPTPSLPAGNASPASPAAQPAEPGTLQVIFDDFELSSDVSIHRNKHKDEIIRANWIQNQLYVDGVRTFTGVDSVMGKVIHKGPETVVRNETKPESYKVVLPAGVYNCEYRIGNTGAEEFEASFPDGVLDKRLLHEKVVIEPASTTLVRIGLKRKLKGLGSSYLYIIN
jgi:hypothetical protein